MTPTSFVVVNLEQHPRQFSFVHGSENGARKEAERLALANPGHRFAVLQFLAEVKAHRPVEWHEFQRTDDLCF